jgi:hypothetical protein
MNNEEAKFILQGYRPNGRDTTDATFCAALDQARLDAGLGQWFAGARAFDAAISAKFAEVQPPAGLREAILAGGRLTAPPAAVPRWWQSRAWLAAAAGVAVLLALSVGFWPKTAAAREALQDFAVADAKHSGTHGGEGADTDALQAMLSNPQVRLGRELPLDFAALRKAGCRTVTFKDRELLEVCFSRDGVWFHCYIAQRADFTALAASAAPVLSERGGASLAAWGDAAHYFVVVSKAGRAPLEKLL